MYNEEMTALGTESSVIRALAAYGEAKKREVGAENVFDFSIGNPTAPPPAGLNAEIARLLREMPAVELHGYTPAAGAPEVRAAVAQSIQTTFGVPMSANGVYMTCGASASLCCIFRAVLQPGEEVVVPAPYFPEYAVFVRQAGGVLVPVPTDGRFHLDVAAIGRAINEKTRIVLINSPNNPTGAVYGTEELRALGALLEERSRAYGRPIVLVSDEPYRELVYGEAPVCPMAVYPDTVICYSFSKSMTLAGERIGYVAVSPRCTEHALLFAAVCGAGRSLGYVCAPALFQRVVAGCLGASSDLSFYRANRDLLYTSLSGMGYACAVPEGAFYLFVKAPCGDAVAFSDRAKEHGLLLVPSDSFGVKGYVRIAYCVPRETIERSLPAFRALLASYRTQS